MHCEKVPGLKNQVHACHTRAGSGLCPCLCLYLCPASASAPAPANYREKERRGNCQNGPASKQHIVVSRRKQDPTAPLCLLSKYLRLTFTPSRCAQAWMATEDFLSRRQGTVGKTKPVENPLAVAEMASAANTLRCMYAATMPSRELKLMDF